MEKTRNAQHLHRRVWRVSANAPLGQVVEITGEPGAKRTEAANTSELRESGWRQSSLELSDGLEVSENQDTVPAELWDELFKR